jgi:hypothetical protein
MFKFPWPQIRWDQVRWETLILAAAILLAGLLISTALRSNRYYGLSDGYRLLDSHTGTIYVNRSGTWEKKGEIK